ncbi:MAG TPA: ABC transporter permease [Candidatus Limnocylindrales bacterium]|nr:ABC transporter permease [Candidatus Limnocylindrales bacterium]
MTAAATTMATSGEGVAARRASRDARIRGVAFAVLGLVAFYFASQSLQVAADFAFFIDRAATQTLPVQTTVGVLWMIAGLASGIVGLLQLARGAAFRWRPWLIVLIAPWIAATLGAVLAGKPANLSGMFSGSLEFAAPIALGAMAGILSERSGMFNIALEGKMLVGACVASVVASVTMLLTDNALLSTLVGIAVAMGASGLLGLLLAWLGIRHRVDQIIAGTVINIGAIGITNFLFLRFLSRNTEFNRPPSVQAMPIPVLSDIPVIGPIMFDSRPYVYVTYILVIVLTYMLFRTRWGLRLRASGEKPAAAGTVGINVLAIRYRSMLIAGMICGLAGSYLSMASGGRFGMEITAGKGFIALAAVIFGAWHPVGAFAAALVFGFAGSTQTLLAVLGVDVPPQLLNSVPYIVTIVVVAGVVGRVRGPAAAGQPYEQG